MVRYIVFSVLNIIAYPISLIIAWILAAVLPTSANDSPGMGMEIGFRFFIYAALSIIIVCIIGFFVSNKLFNTVKPALIINGIVIGVIFFKVLTFIING